MGFFDKLKSSLQKVATDINDKIARTEVGRTLGFKSSRVTVTGTDAQGRPTIGEISRKQAKQEGREPIEFSVAPISRPQADFFTQTFKRYGERGDAPIKNLKDFIAPFANRSDEEIMDLRTKEIVKQRVKDFQQKMRTALKDGTMTPAQVREEVRRYKIFGEHIRKDSEHIALQSVLEEKKLAQSTKQTGITRQLESKAQFEKFAS